jgi:hypothetical protein
MPAKVSRQLFKQGGRELGDATQLRRKPGFTVVNNSREEMIRSLRFVFGLKQSLVDFSWRVDDRGFHLTGCSVHSESNAYAFTYGDMTTKIYDWLKKLSPAQRDALCQTADLENDYSANSKGWWLMTNDTSPSSSRCVRVIPW